MPSPVSIRGIDWPAEPTVFEWRDDATLPASELSRNTLSPIRISSASDNAEKKEGYPADDFALG